jgi:acetoin utilization deacetylase AcuC-like enzyme
MPDNASAPRDPARHPRGETAFVAHPDYEMNIGAHVFPTAKFRLAREALARSGDLDEALVYRSPMPSEAQLLLAMDRAYLEDFAALRRTERTRHSELPLTAGIVRGCQLCAGGSILAARLALEGAAGAVHLGGGFHHAFRGHAEGFCYVNDIAAAALAMLEEGRCRRVAVVDVDVHQGNGTARIFQDDPRVFTFSIHQEDNYPALKQKSDIDVGLPDGTDGGAYLDALRGPLERIFGSFKPDLMIYVAGVDPYQGDVLGGLGLTIGDMRRRDEACLFACAEAGVPFATVTAGGYARDQADTVAMHANTARAALEAGKLLARRRA